MKIAPCLCKSWFYRGKRLLHAKYPNPDEVHCDILMTSKKGLHDASGPQEGYLISLYTAFWAFCLERNFMPLLFDTRGEFLTNLLQFGGNTEDERLGVPKCGFYYSSPYKKTTFKAGIEMNLLPCLVILIYKV